MKEIVPGIVTWGVRSEPHGYDFNGTYVRHPGGNVCIDPVEPPAEVLALMRREGVACIVLTNRNHTRQANKIRAATGAFITIHPADAAHARAQGARVERLLAPDDRIGPFTVFAMPGKSPGEIALHDPARRLVVVGDALIGNPPGKLSLLPERVIDDVTQLRASVRALLALDVATVLVGDGESIVSRARDPLHELVGSFPA